MLPKTREPSVRQHRRPSAHAKRTWLADVGAVGTSRVLFDNVALEMVQSTKLCP
jgi:hypothetical protein